MQNTDKQKHRGMHMKKGIVEVIDNRSFELRNMVTMLVLESKASWFVLLNFFHFTKWIYWLLLFLEFEYYLMTMIHTYHSIC